MQKRLIQLGAASTVIAAATLLFHSQASAVCTQVNWPSSSPQVVNCPGTGGHTYTRTNPPNPTPDKVTANATSSAMARIQCKVTVLGSPVTLLQGYQQGAAVFTCPSSSHNVSVIECGDSDDCTM
jgi:hypothetical protein